MRASPLLSKLHPRNLETSLRADNQSSRQGREGGEADQERNLTYQLASRSEGLTPRGPLTVRRFVFRGVRTETRSVQSFYNVFIVLYPLLFLSHYPSSSSWQRGTENASGQVKESPWVRVPSKPMAQYLTSHSHQWVEVLVANGLV